MTPEDHAVLREGLRRLPPRERIVLAWLYGLDGGGERTRGEIGAALGLTGSEVGIVERWGKKRIREDRYKPTTMWGEWQYPGSAGPSSSEDRIREVVRRRGGPP